MCGIYPWTKTTTCESWMRTILEISSGWLFLLHPLTLKLWWVASFGKFSKSLESLQDSLFPPPPPTSLQIFHEQLWMLEIWKDMISLLVRCLFPPIVNPLWEFNHAHSLSLSQRILKRSVHVYTHLVQHFDKEYPFCLLRPIFLWKFQWRTGGTKKQKYFMWMTFPSSWFSLKVL